MSTGYAVLGLGMIIAGPLTNAIGARAVWGISAGLTAVGALLGFLFIRSVVTERPAAGVATASE